MIGFCLNTHNGTNGYYNGNCLAMLDLHSGYTYCPSLGQSKGTAFYGTQGMIITSVIDVSNKLISFYFNGNQLIHSTKFIITDTDFRKICPCIDLCIAGDKVSIVKY